MARKPVNENAMKALQEMKLEIANELGYRSTNTGDASKGMARNIAEIGERELSLNDKDTFNPS